MAKRTCEICGRPTDDADFSKSYKRRCKECVAREAREARAVKTATEGEPEYIRIPGTCLDDTPDWEQRRYDLALTIFLEALHEGELPHTAAQQARDAADNFITIMQETEEDEP